MAPEGDHLRVSDPEAGHPVHAHGAFVVGQRVGRHPTRGPQGSVETDEDGAQGPVPGRHHHPKARPSQPGAEEVGLPHAHRRAPAPVKLQPHPGLRDPGPVGAPVAFAVRGLRFTNRPPGRAFIAAVAQRA